ncbi:hypothetical protein [Symmachiella dynata]|uniref:hypothetical protein n=1 Tax=Symmachiella dynata TaxID=2527995 RepID=UPI0030EF480C
MNADQSSSQREVVHTGRLSRNLYAVLLVGLAVVVSLAVIVFLRPHVDSWLEVSSAYRNLSSTDPNEQDDAIRRLRSLGEETESHLIALLHHSDANVRYFAASELAHKTRVSDNIIEAFLIALENKQHVAEIGDSAPKLFFRHAEKATGPLTETDQRMIAWLKPRLNSNKVDQSGTAAWALAAFVNRDPSLREPLVAYLKKGVFFYKYLVLQEMVDSDPSLRDEYVDVLLSGLGSPVHTDQTNALHGLAILEIDPDELRSRLEARREEATEPGEISRIDQALEELREKEAEQL